MTNLLLIISVVIATLVLQKTIAYLRNAKEKSNKEKALKLLKANGYEPELYLATIGTDDPQLRDALDQFAFTGHVIKNRHGAIIGGVVPKAKPGLTKPSLKLVVSND
ncbi:hypothetical protein AB4586_00040 [Vibrio sp. 10N.222.49.E4]|jgi:hypothetical protein|uniref:Uncharacterized protein n=2 Tax=Vibrio cyclitrophicus TaxID=47951 RepID=A0A7Z1MHV4_9VIBR|nr:hypothetical protein [Vibrio cyclitrophicus]PMP24582.1 hypothetical protein BCS91_13820 [Vibrio cyclitrophicus]PMP28175.1 hypothetical protein BCS90_20245 [Vibrio cyclitrophicus]